MEAVCGVGDVELSVGESVCVDIETVFQEGVVVSFTDGEGVEYRGALLQQDLPLCSNSEGESSKRSLQHPSIMSPNNLLANPLSLLHDHPYGNLEGYARKLTKAVPTNILLQWNSVPSPPSPALHATVGNSPILKGVESRTHSRTGSPTNPCGNNNNNNNNNSSSLAVETINIPEDDVTAFDTVYPFFIPGVDRHAKLLATLKIKAGSSMFMGTSKGPTPRSRTRRARNGRLLSPVLKHRVSPSTMASPPKQRCETGAVHLPSHLLSAGPTKPSDIVERNRQQCEAEAVYSLSHRGPSNTVEQKGVPLRDFCIHMNKVPIAKKALFL